VQLQAIVAGVVLLILAVGGYWLVRLGRKAERGEQKEDEARAHEAAHKAGEAFDAGGGLAGGIRRARRLRDADKAD